MNANQFIKALEQMRGWRECIFILALAERAFPNYVLFDEAIGAKKGAKMRLLLDEAWGMVEEKAGDARVTQALARLESLAPNPDGYDMYGVYPADDFCKLLEQALLNRLNSTRPRALDASQWATATVAQFIEMSEGEDLDEDALVRLLDRHELMKVDKVFQRDLVHSLKKQRVPTAEFLRSIRTEAANDGVSNLGIALEDE
ncbi:YjaG family protein [Marinobacter sp. JSM 1782161]|uniref:YjaG family protein n=1 Tax=Marinobacter sp. JSM 1782161 TaxID=2685906 RepID=UPI0014036004|nr:YjaG family protein [Marinobacter sp. JSM 1782161]